MFLLWGRQAAPEALEALVTAPIVSPESVLDARDTKLIQTHARVRQLETEHVADQVTIAALADQRDKAKHAGAILIGKLHDAERELAQAQELIRAQALTLETMTNDLRRAQLDLARLDPACANRRHTA